MAGAAWEPADWEWRPTWLPASRLPGGCSPVAATPAGQQSHSPPDASQPVEHQRQQDIAFLAGLANALAALDSPRQGLQLLRDTQLLTFYREGIRNAVASVGQGARVLVVGRCSVLLALVAVEAGAAVALCIERDVLCQRMAAALLDANRAEHGEMCRKVRLLPCTLAALKDRAMQQEGGATAAAPGAAAAPDEQAVPAGAGSNADGSSSSPECDGAEQSGTCSVDKQDEQSGTCSVVARSAGDDEALLLADILVVDLFDHRWGRGGVKAMQHAASCFESKEPRKPHTRPTCPPPACPTTRLPCDSHVARSVLGLDPLGAIRLAAGQGLLSPGAQVVPACVSVQAAMTQVWAVGLLAGAWGLAGGGMPALPGCRGGPCYRCTQLPYPLPWCLAPAASCQRNQQWTLTYRRWMSTAGSRAQWPWMHQGESALGLLARAPAVVQRRHTIHVEAGRGGGVYFCVHDVQ